MTRELLGGLGTAEWDDLSGSAFYSSSGWLRICAGSPGVTVRAVVAGPDGPTRAAVPTVTFDAAVPGNYDWHAILRGRGLPALPSRGLLVGPNLGYRTDLLLGPRGHESVPALLDAIRREGTAVAMYLSTPDVVALRTAGVEAFPVLLEPDAWIPVPDGGWEAWLAGLKSHRRREVLREIAGFDAQGYRVHEQPLPDCVERLPVLAVELARKVGGFDTDPARFAADFRRYAEALGDQLRVALCEDREGRLVGFCMYVVRGGTVWLRWASFDFPRLDGNGYEYFNLCYYRQIRLARQLGATRVHAGKKVLQAKVMRGARLHPLWLLDLSADSPHARDVDRTRAHNTHAYGELRSAPWAARAIADPREWEAFC